MWNWIRKIPHPKYGKCGGSGKDCSTKPPRDWMDKAFEIHDEELYNSKTKKDRIQADNNLARALRQGDPKKLKLWGKIYLTGAKLVFRIKF